MKSNTQGGYHPIFQPPGGIISRYSITFVTLYMSAYNGFYWYCLVIRIVFLIFAEEQL